MPFNIVARKGSLAGTRSRALMGEWWRRGNSHVASWAAGVQAEGQNRHRVFRRVKSDSRQGGWGRVRGGEESRKGHWEETGSTREGTDSGSEHRSHLIWLML